MRMASQCICDLDQDSFMILLPVEVGACNFSPQGFMEAVMVCNNLDYFLIWMISAIVLA